MRNQSLTQYDKNLASKGLSRQEVVERERQLAKFANMMDSVVRIPFTKQGVGADAALSTIPIAGDIAGLILTAYAFRLGRRLGVPARNLTPAVRLALVDLVIGIVPAAGTLMDIFIRPSRRTLDIVRDYIQVEYGIEDTGHIEHPFLHESLHKRQKKSAFWRNSIIAWLYIHLPDIFGLIVLILIGLALWTGISWIMSLLSNYV